MQKTNSSTILLVFVAVLFGLLAVYAVRRLGRTPVVVAAAQVPQKLTIPLASRDLPIGRVVALSDVALVSMTKEQMKAQGITGMFMSDPKQVIGSMVKSEVKRGKTFHTEQFYPDGFRPDVTDRLKDGQRAITIIVGSDNALSGYAYAGQHVDLIFRLGESQRGGFNASKLGKDENGNRTWDPKLGYHAVSSGGNWKYTYDDRTGRTSGGSSRGDSSSSPYAATTVTLIQGVEILALENDTLQDSARQLPVDSDVRVTIAVTPDQAATLKAVEGRGELSLALRNPTDNQIVEDVQAKTLEDILGVKPVESVPQQIQRRNEKMEVYRGSALRQLEFDGSHPLAVRIDPEFFRRRSLQDTGETEMLTGDDPATPTEAPTQSTTISKKDLSLDPSQF